MAFNRANISQSSSFSRSGLITESITNPDFSTFRVDPDKTNYGLGPNWSIQITSSTNTLDFNYNNASVFQLTSSGFSLSGITLTELGALPVDVPEGTLSHVNGALYIYT